MVLYEVMLWLHYVIVFLAGCGFVYLVDVVLNRDIIKRKR